MTKNVGAPESKIKITPEMIEAGADVIWTFFYDAVGSRLGNWPRGGKCGLSGHE
jgi:hypothetical protein